ncbi:MAG: hypothetical protein H7318_03665 [Oligoflexus sp.]|nr:hypothetical protein [Oligoflexus sp.]
MQATSQKLEHSATFAESVNTSEVLANKSAKKPPHLLGRTTDALMIGGASLLFFAISYLFVDKNAPVNQIAWVAFYAAFIINNPHFMASYCLLYWDKRHLLLKDKRFLWAGIIAPGLVLGYMAYFIRVGGTEKLSYVVNVMYFTVGWHYIKQIYGTMLVTNARQGYYFNSTESWILKATLYPVWFMSYTNSNQAIQSLMHYGIAYKTFQLPAWTVTASYSLMGISIVVLAAMFGRKWIKDGKIPPLSGMISILVIYVWYLPQLYHAVFWYTIPFFHSLQYMLFVTTLKKNQYTAKAEAFADPVQSRMSMAKNFFGFFALIGVMAYLSFNLVPETLDKYVPYDHNVFGPQMYMFCFITFINVHHYFIDNVIWRRDNQDLKKYL